MINNHGIMTHEEIKKFAYEATQNIKNAIIKAHGDSSHFDYYGYRIEIDYEFKSTSEPYYVVKFNTTDAGLRFDARAMQQSDVVKLVDPIIKGATDLLRAAGEPTRCERAKSGEIRYIYFD